MAMMPRRPQEGKQRVSKLGLKGLLGSWDEVGHLLIIVCEPFLHLTGLIFFLFHCLQHLNVLIF